MTEHKSSPVDKGTPVPTYTARLFFWRAIVPGPAGRSQLPRRQTAS